MQETQTHRSHLALSGFEPHTEPGQFEVLAITAGEGNGWIFPAETLRQSLALWEGVETFVDHGGWAEPNRSVRDLGGVCSGARWDEAAGGVKLVLKTAGPSRALVEALGREWLAEAEPRPKLGFSADVLFTARGREVQQILRVLSLDLVFNPARGGAFVRALNSLQTQEGFMEEQGIQSSATGLETDGHLQELRLELSATLVETRLAASGLPVVLRDRLRKQFAGKAIRPADLETAIEDSRRLVADLQGGSVVAGIQGGALSGVVSSEERLQAAVDDLLGAPRDPAMNGVRVDKLTGIRELYTMLTGDVELHGGYDANRVKLETTATMPGLVKNACNKIIAQTWEELGRAGYSWWQKVAAVEHFNSLNPVTGVLVGEVGDLPEVAEDAPYTALHIADSPETGDWKKYGGYLPITLELIDRDDVFRLRSYPRKLANASLRKISALVAGVFTQNAGTGPTMADGLALFQIAAHQNLGAEALSSASWETACQAVFNQSMLVRAGNSGPKLALEPRYLLVPRAQRLTAMQILYPGWERAANIFSQNMQQGEPGDVVVVPEWGDASDWAAVCDPRLAPAIIVAERFGLQPEIFIAGDEQSPAMFTNDEVRLKVRHFLSVFVADYRPLYKANVA